MKNLRNIGKEMEDISSEFLLNNGYRILERNVHSRFAEADIVALDDYVLCFIEVKYRSHNFCGTAEEAITPNKIKRIINLAKFYLMKHPEYQQYEIRFDVVAINGSKINLIKGAFDAF